ncbi:LOW QUALITY PROTEIN: DNA-(apurinic or apyrimidinic site) endonuclease 2-like [Macrobrachium nipponense]|uniref:LOW QUALITY PROTEIN: DNA-(apurinic or apyrimidinic site) endonuclease 2-like n=1 Tax=Macrobrachium nipponense TaxID=159736 RepID=UPI0030C83EF4
MAFRVLSWNINGLRSFKTDMKEFLTNLGADVICFQETKVTRDMLEEPLAIVEGYSSYFSFSRKRSGYSGVATFCLKEATPVYAQEGLSGLYGGNLLDKGGTPESLAGHWTEEELRNLDSEGRAIITQHSIKGNSSMFSAVAVINVYCPRVDPEKPERRAYKLRFYELLRQRAAAIYSTGCHVIIVGDINTSHKRIDHCDPDDIEDFELRLDRRYLDKFLIPIHKEENTKSTDDERNSANETSNTLFKKAQQPQGPKISDSEFVTEQNGIPLDDSAYGEDVHADEYLLESASDFHVVDTFRYFYPNKRDAFTCWNTFTNARSSNYGTRIDYIFCDESLLPFVEESAILQDVMGSDHCPVVLRVKGEVINSSKLPDLCTKFFPEFKGNQQKLSSYFESVATIPAIKADDRVSQLSCGNKRKISESKSKPTSNKKQSKLNSYFTVKPKDAEESKVVSKDEAKLKENKSCFQNAINRSVSSYSRIEHCLKPSDKESLERVNKICDDSISIQNEQEKGNNSLEKRSPQKSGWGFMMKGPKNPPLCPGHQEPTVVRTVKKKGPNMNKQFYACARGAGREGDPNAQCNFFQWVGKK